MNQHVDIDRELATLLGERDTPEAAARGRGVALQRLEAEAAGGRPARTRSARTNRARGPRRGMRRTRVLIGVGLAVLLVSGVAVAANTELADRILGSTEPAAERIELIRTDPRPTMTRAELIEHFRASIVRDQMGASLSGELSAPLVQDERTRISARRTADGSVYVVHHEFMSWDADTPKSWRLRGGAVVGFEDGWPLVLNTSRDSERGTVSYGLVADGVDSVRFIVDGQVHEALMGDGAFLWRYPAGAEPTGIEVMLTDGTVVRRSMT